MILYARGTPIDALAPVDPPDIGGRVMTCYQRHLGWLFDAIDLPSEKQNRRRLHAVLVELLPVPADAKCPEVWAALKAHYRVDTKTPSGDLVAAVAEALEREMRA